LRSVCNKGCEISYFLEDNDPDFMGITETWLVADMPSSVFVDTGRYNIVRKDRMTRGGGVSLVIKKCLALSWCEVTLPKEYCDIDVLAVDVADGSAVQPFRLVVVYRPPDFSNVNNALLFAALNYLAESCVRLCILGDLNLPQFNWDLCVCPQTSLYTAAADFVCNHGLTQLVDFPTRGNNILDVVLCSDVLCCDDVECLPPIGTSDHCVVKFNFNISIQQVPSKQDCSTALPNYSKADWQGLCVYLSSVNWLSEFQYCEKVGDYWDRFLSIINDSIENNVPKYRSSRHIISHIVYPKKNQEIDCR
jgi:Endonuclease-reverse transcriptase